MTSLNPTMKVGRQITEVILQHKKFLKTKQKRAIELLTQVGIPFLKNAITNTHMSFQVVCVNVLLLPLPLQLILSY